MRKKIIYSVFIVLLIFSGLLAYEYNNFTKQQALNNWCNVQITSTGNLYSFEFVNFSLFDRKLSPYVAIITDHETGIHNKTLSGYENNVSTPDLDTLKTLANYYKVSIDSILENTEMNIPSQKYQAKKVDIEEILAQDQVWFRDMLLNQSEIQMIINGLEAIYIRVKAHNKPPVESSSAK